MGLKATHFVVEMGMGIYIIYMWPVAMALVFKVLMMIWMHPAESTYQLVELFSGQGEVSRVFRAIGRSVGSYDKELVGNVWILPFQPVLRAGLTQAAGCMSSILYRFESGYEYQARGFAGLFQLEFVIPRTALWMCMCIGALCVCVFSFARIDLLPGSGWYIYIYILLFSCTCEVLGGCYWLLQHAVHGQKSHVALPVAA